MFKRVIGTLTALIMTFTACAATTVAASEADNEAAEKYKGFLYEHEIQSEEPLFMLDFEKYNLSNQSATGFTGLGKGTKYPKDGVGGGTSFAAVGWLRPYINLEEPINEGLYMLSFDVRRSLPESWFYIRMNLDNGTTFDSFAMYSTQAGHNSYWNITGAKECAANEWHHINMFLDFDKSKVYYYIDNEYSTEASGLPELRTLTFMIEGSSNQVTSLDNIAMFKFSPDLRTELDNLGVEIPESFGGDFSIETESEYEGNIFTDFDDVNLQVKVTNKLKEEQKYDISYYATRYNGEVVWSDEEKDISIGANAEVVHNISPKVDKYDIYTLHTTVTPHSEGSDPVLRDKEFSVAHVPSPGYKSDYIGACTHPGRWTRWNEVRRAINLAGIGYLRTDVGWQSYETEKGKYGGKFEAERYTPNFYAETAEDGIDNILIFWMNNDNYISSNRELAQDPDALAALEKAAENFAREYKGRASVIELGNEVNFERIENCTPDEYAVISAAAYRGIKKGNPDATVLSPGLSRSAANWIYRYLTALDEPVCDAIAIHLYQEAGSPESKKYDEYCMEVKNAMIRAGYPDMELWQTEGNTSAHYSYSTEQQHGVNLVRQFAYCQAYDLLDKFVFYQLQTAESNPDDNESYFGVLRGRSVNNANGPKQSYMALTNFVAMTENAKHSDLIQYDNVYIHKYTRDDGTNILMMYADRDCKITSLDLGASSGTLYDINGNATELKSPDGKYVFSIADQPVYFEYRGDKFERCDEFVSLDKDMVDAAMGNVEEFNLTVPEDAELSVYGNSKLNAVLTKDGNKAKVTINVEQMPVITNLPGIGNIANVDYTERRHDFGTQLYRDYVDVVIEQNGQQSALVRLPVEYDFKSANVSMKVKPYDNTNTKFWAGVVNVFNNTSKPISGTVKITEPAEIADSISEMKVENVEPGKSKEVQFNIPEEYCSGYHKYGGIFTTSDGEEISFLLGDTPESYGYAKAGACAFGVVEKTKDKTPVIDGIIDADEWQAHKITDFDKSNVSYGSQGIINAGVVEAESFGKDADYGGKADFSGTIYAQWDDKYFYTAAVVYDDVHWQKQEPVRFYYDDHFYITLQATYSQRHDTRIEFALSDYFDDERYTDEERHGMMYRNWSQMFDVTVGGVMPQSEDGCQVKVVRKENVTIYEARIPLTEMYSPETLANKPIQSGLGFNIRDYDGDRDKTFSWSGWFALVDTKQ